MGLTLVARQAGRPAAIKLETQMVKTTARNDRLKLTRSVCDPAFWAPVAAVCSTTRPSVQNALRPVSASRSCPAPLLHHRSRPTARNGPSRPPAPPPLHPHERPSYLALTFERAFGAPILPGSPQARWSLGWTLDRGGRGEPIRPDSLLRLLDHRPAWGAPPDVPTPAALGRSRWSP